jgi:hypothetical protein
MTPAAPTASANAPTASQFTISLAAQRIGLQLQAATYHRGLSAWMLWQGTRDQLDTEP